MHTRPSGLGDLFKEGSIQFRKGSLAAQEFVVDLYDPSCRKILVNNESSPSPCPMASTAAFGPVTTSPPAKTPSTFVAMVSGSAIMVFLFRVFISPRRLFSRTERSQSWPMAEKIWSHLKRNSESVFWRGFSCRWNPALQDTSRSTPVRGGFRCPSPLPWVR